jgi:hypothetical protein
MDLDQLVDLVATHCEENDLPTKDLKEALDQEIRRRKEARLQAWMKKTKTIFEREYTEKYGLDSKQWGAILDQEIIPPYREATPDGRRCYRDKPPTKAQLKKIANNTYYSTKSAAEYLGISTSTFNKIKKKNGLEPKDPPWQPKTEWMRYEGNFYLQADLDKLDVQVKPKKISPALQAAWDDLNDRQRTYLEVVYKIERQKARYYESSDSMYDEKRKGGEWRWILHHSDEKRQGIDMILKRKGMLDKGTGSTYAALETRGHIETRLDPEWLPFEVLWVKLTRSGRRLIKAMTA